jgi:hypothetical protein
MLKNEPDVLTALSTYIDGKMKRYSLMFAVNGGAFAVAKLMTEAGTASDTVLLGHLKLWHLALGAILFTILIVVDIYLFAQMMKKRFLGDSAFNLPGKMILISLGVLLVAAWGLVATG